MSVQSTAPVQSPLIKSITGPITDILNAASPIATSILEFDYRRAQLQADRGGDTRQTPNNTPQMSNPYARVNRSDVIIGGLIAIALGVGIYAVTKKK